MSLTDGVIRCTFTRTAFLDDDDVLFFDLRPGNKYTILLAWGGSLSNGNAFLLTANWLETTEYV